MGTLSGEFHLSMRKVQAVLSHVMGMHFSLGTISAAHGTVAHALAAPVQQLCTQIQHAPVCHADETRHQSHSRTLWTWVQTSDWGASFKIDPSRGQAAAKQVLGESPSFVLVSDRYAAYNFVPMEQRQVCWAHLLRDFERIAQRAGQAGRIGARLLGCGYLLFRWREQQKSSAHYQRLQRRIRRLLEQGSHPSHCTRTARTCQNLLKSWPALWTFMDNPLVPPTNNAAERALRGYVLKRKISYCTRSKQGLDFSERIFSTVQTCKMQGKVAYSFITNAVQSWLGKASFPSLVPEHIHLHHACA